jgi:hypothetical protein
MSTKDVTQRRMNIVLLATGLVFLAVFSLQSVDIPVRGDAMGMPDTGPAGEGLRRNNDRIPSAPPVPPALQKGFLR